VPATVVERLDHPATEDRSTSDVLDTPMGAPVELWPVTS
jgi:hypothetical protein